MNNGYGMPYGMPNAGAPNRAQNGIFSSMPAGMQGQMPGPMPGPMPGQMPGGIPVGVQAGMPNANQNPVKNEIPAAAAPKPFAGFSLTNLPFSNVFGNLGNSWVIVLLIFLVVIPSLKGLGKFTGTDK